MSTEELPPRESMEFDVVIVGAGPSGLAAAIRLKQLNADLTIVVVEKGSEVGAHILSGAVIDPVSLDQLIPDWRDDADCPLKTQVKTDKFYWMTAGTAVPRPKYFTMKKARCVASRPATWASPRMARTNRRIRVAWSCSASTRCLPKARAVA